MESNLSARAEIVRLLRSLDGDQALLMIDEIKDSIKDEKDETRTFEPSPSETEEEWERTVKRITEDPIEHNMVMLNSVLQGIPPFLPKVKSAFPALSGTDAKEQLDAQTARLLRDASELSSSSKDFVMGNGLEFLNGLQIYLEACEHARLLMSPEELSSVGKLPKEAFERIPVNLLKVIYRERALSHKVNSIGLLVSNEHEEEYYRTSFYETHQRMRYPENEFYSSEETDPDSWSGRYR